jgi:hypothetical protein
VWTATFPDSLDDYNAKLLAFQAATDIERYVPCRTGIEMHP